MHEDGNAYGASDGDDGDQGDGGDAGHDDSNDDVGSDGEVDSDVGDKYGGDNNMMMVAMVMLLMVVMIMMMVAMIDDDDDDDGCGPWACVTLHSSCLCCIQCCPRLLFLCKLGLMFP